VKDAFQAALVHNQSGDRPFIEIWEPMVKNGAHPWLRGDEIVGYEGILVRFQTVKKDFSEIFWALTTISHRWSGTADDQLAFHRMIERIPKLERREDAHKLIDSALSTGGWSDWARPKYNIFAADEGLEVKITFGEWIITAVWPYDKPDEPVSVLFQGAGGSWEDPRSLTGPPNKRTLSNAVCESVGLFVETSGDGAEKELLHGAAYRALTVAA
jgi:hypothetical protein